MAALAVLAVLAPALLGAEERDVPMPWLLTVDPEASRIGFSLGATLHTVEGSARLDGGRVHFDPLTGAARGRLLVDATTLATGNERRDRDMHGKVLESGTYPTIAFTVEGLAGGPPPEGGFELELSGRLEIHGGSHPLTVPVRGRIEGGVLSAEAAFVVPYVEWGMKDPSKFLLRVAKEVEVEVALAGTVAPAAPFGDSAPAPDR